MNITQEPKYAIVGDQIVNRATGVPIPADEPIMLFRAKDVLAAPHALGHYVAECRRLGLPHAAAVEQRFQDFTNFAAAHPERMHMPDTAMPLGTTAKPAPEVQFGIEMTPAQSSNLEAYGYRASDRTLALRFKGGAVYHYAGVPVETFQALASAPSKGSYAHSITRGFEGKRMNEPTGSVAA